MFTCNVGGVCCEDTLPYVSSCDCFAERGQLKAAVLGYGITLPEGRLIKTFVTVMLKISRDNLEDFEGFWRIFPWMLPDLWEQI